MLSRRSLLTIPAAAVLRGAGVCDSLPAYRSTVDGTEQPYALYVPAKIEPDTRLPLVISLHGAGQDHQTGLRQFLGDSAPGCLVAAPYGRGSMGYEGIAETDVYDVVADVCRKFPVDVERTYLTGVSMGGSGTFSLALRRPDFWAAIAPVCGGAPGQTPQLAGNALQLPVRMRHGDADETVPIAVAREWRSRLEQMQVPLDYAEYPQAGHNIAPRAYANGEALQWLLQHRRNRQPRRVWFATREYDRSSAYWVQVDQVTPGKTALLEAVIVSPGEIRVSPRDAGAFTLALGGLPQLADDLKLFIDDERPLRVRKGDVHVTRGGRWELTEARALAARRAGCDGPIRNVFSRRHVYVYGTTNARSGPEEVWSRMEIAQRAADWAGRKARPAASFAVLPDTEALREPEATNLVLFGTARTNLLLAKWRDLLPLQLQEAAAGEWGLLFVYPVQGRLALISAGLPWWTRPSREQREGFRWQWLSLPYRLTLDLPDYVLFRESMTNTVAAGYFSNDWRLPAEAKASLLATKVLEVE